MTTTLRIISTAGMCILAALGPSRPSAADTRAGVSRCIHGTLEGIERSGKAIRVRTAQGTVAVVQIGERTVVRGTTDLAAAAREGGHVIVQLAGDALHAGGRVAESVAYVGEHPVSVLEGTFDRLGEDGQTVAITARDGVHSVFRIGDGAVKRGFGDIERGARVSVYYTTEAGQKVAHALAW